MLIVIRRLLDVPATDPDDARRRKLLNILLGGFVVLSVLGLVATVFAAIIGSLGGADFEAVLIINSAFLIGIIIIFSINRYWSGLVASSVFLIFLVLLIAFSDSPE